jgi:2-polyprenyl-3-methyl-5-hydroxy-6-metoxy-1,4-benzoquinol methylase
VAEKTLEDLVARLERERLEADRRYNDALTAIDRAVRRAEPALPAVPAPRDETKLGEANQAWDILPHGTPAFDRSIRGRLGAFVWRLVGPALDAQKHFNATLVDHLNRSVASDRDEQAAIGALLAGVGQQFDALARFQSLLVQYLQTITAYVDTKDRSLGGPELRQQIVLAHERTLALKRDVERLSLHTVGAGLQAGPHTRGEASQAGLEAGPIDSAAEASKYVGFEDRFRGSREEIRGRLRDYLPLLAGASEVVDVGCGRGEFLELMREAGIFARGIDVNSEMVEVCRERGLAVEEADALRYVAAQRDASLGGLTAIQVVEHFEPSYLARFLEAAHHAMRPGAVLILETINPACWMAFFETYLRDLTHARPLHADTLRFLVQASGFTNAEVIYRAPVSEGDRLPRVEAPAGVDPAISSLVEALNAHADRLNQRLFGSMDYALVAHR